MAVEDIVSVQPGEGVGEIAADQVLGRAGARAADRRVGQDAVDDAPARRVVADGHVSQPIAVQVSGPGDGPGVTRQPEAVATVQG